MSSFLYLLLSCFCQRGWSMTLPCIGLRFGVRVFSQKSRIDCWYLLRFNGKCMQIHWTYWRTIICIDGGNKKTWKMFLPPTLKNHLIFRKLRTFLHETRGRLSTTSFFTTTLMIFFNDPYWSNSRLLYIFGELHTTCSAETPFFLHMKKDLFFEGSI